MQTTFVRQTTENSEAPSHEGPEAGAAASGGLRSKGRPRRAKQANVKERSGGGINSNRSLIEALSNSKVFQDYERAFTEATGLPVALRAVESWQLPHHGRRNESPFCALVLETSRACASCLQVQERLSAGAAEEAYTVHCPAGLCDTAVPVRLGDRLIGFLQTGQVFRKTPTRPQFERTLRLVNEWGVHVDPAKLEQAYFGTRVVPKQAARSGDQAALHLRPAPLYVEQPGGSAAG